MLTFGPVPSRRLGRSLGVNNIPPKFCSYACVYCQLGRTIQLRARRQSFYAPALLLDEVTRRVEACAAAGEPIDYLSFVPDGEPTLDIGLGETLALLRPLGIPIAVISNTSLLRDAAVRHELCAADWVSLKVDAVWEDLWRRIDRPHGSLSLPAILEGARQFAGEYQGVLVTETMLVGGVNDSTGHLRALADFLAGLAPRIVYLSVPTRPPAESWVHPPAAERINAAYQIVSGRLPAVECLTGYEGNAFACTGDAASDLLSITAVHPLRQDAIEEVLRRAGADDALLHDLVARGDLIETTYQGQRYYLRNLRAGRS
jgi:wyosine [tRNA(Phe)-imidazoG37] synthetase (radical SAM superfamily)